MVHRVALLGGQQREENSVGGRSLRKRLGSRGLDAGGPAPQTPRLRGVPTDNRAGPRVLLSAGGKTRVSGWGLGAWTRGVICFCIAFVVFESILTQRAQSSS